MNESFRRHVESLHPTFERLMTGTPFKVAAMPQTLEGAGVYLFSENGQHLYVGRTNGLRKRIQQHCRPSSRDNSAPFAFRLARESCGAIKATYKPKGGRKELIKMPEFAAAFTEAKVRLRSMEIRTVVESHPQRQALLEMYVAIALNTPYNDFHNH